MTKPKTFDDAVAFPMTFALSKEIEAHGDTVRELSAKEPLMGDALDAGVLDDRRAENMVELMQRVFAVPPSTIKALALTDYVKISRALSRFIDAPASDETSDAEAEPAATAWPATIALSKPLPTGKGALTKLTLREPTTGDCMVTGLLDGTAGVRGLAELAALVSGVEFKDLRALTIPDFSRVTALFGRFLSQAGR